MCLNVSLWTGQTQERLLGCVFECVSECHCALDRHGRDVTKRAIIDVNSIVSG